MKTPTDFEAAQDHDITSEWLRDKTNANIMTKRKNIKVKPETFEQLKKEKPDGVDWSYYLTEIRTIDE